MTVLQQSQALDIARRHLLDSGQVPDGLVTALVADSWQRSLKAGLDPCTYEAEAPHISAPQLARIRERERELIDYATPAMTYMASQARDSGSIITLSNADGVHLYTCGDANFVDRASRVHISPGASWNEAHRGTNAVGTALALGAPIVVTGGEHFFSCHEFLTCAAAPISDSRGQLLGILNISGVRTSCHPHTFGLIRATAQMIENRLFLERHGADVRLHFHPLAEGIGTLAEGLIAVNYDGWLVGANPAGLALLSRKSNDLNRVRIDQIVGIGIDALIDWAKRCADQPLFLPRGAQGGLFVRVEMSRHPVTVVMPQVSDPSVPTLPSDALQQLDTGDARMTFSVNRARRVMDKDIPLLIFGESGVGKELFAKAVHQSGSRKDGPFLAVNCAALPENLIEAELFGYASGAYTGARKEGSPGLIREANGGTLFLDEIGDMPYALQARLLRVLQERVVNPLGGGRAVSIDFALISATNCHLKEAVDAGRFRADLYYRINGMTLTLPPLRERSDFNLLVASLLETFGPNRRVGLTHSVAKAFASHFWPGNLRELANVLRTSCALLADNETCIDWMHLPEDLIKEFEQRMDGNNLKPRPGTLHSKVDNTILRAINTTKGNIADAARRLGISRTTLYRRLKSLDISSIGTDYD